MTQKWYWTLIMLYHRKWDIDIDRNIMLVCVFAGGVSQWVKTDPDMPRIGVITGKK
jgi:hypothetical protein